MVRRDVMDRVLQGTACCGSWPPFEGWRAGDVTSIARGKPSGKVNEKIRSEELIIYAICILSNIQ